LAWLVCKEGYGKLIHPSVCKTASKQNHDRSVHEPVIGGLQEQVKGSQTTTGLQLHGQAVETVLLVHMNAHLATLTPSHSRA